MDETSIAWALKNSNPALQLQYRLQPDHILELKVAKNAWMKWTFISLAIVINLLIYFVLQAFSFIPLMLIPLSFLSFIMGPSPQQKEAFYAKFEQLKPDYLEHDTVLKVYPGFLVETRRSQDRIFPFSRIKANVKARQTLGLRLDDNSLLIIDRKSFKSPEDEKSLLSLIKEK